MHAPSLLVLALQWTLLLVLAWGAHALLRQGHPRWRVILWRSVLCLGLLLPLWSLWRLPRLIEVPAPSFATTVFPAVAPQETASNHLGQRPVTSEAFATSSRVSASAVNEDATTHDAAPPNPQHPPVLPSLSWWSLLAALWVIGSLSQAFLFLRQHLRLGAIVRSSHVAPPEIQALAWQIQSELKVRRPVRVRFSDDVASPLLCGVVAPLILIPRRIVDDMTPSELMALLSHELAHACRNDLAWCIAWRGVRAVAWFHPLVWGVPAAHGLACEEEADRIAARREYDGKGYDRLLAQLALRIVEAPAAETPLALNATSHLARRLLRLGRACASNWTAAHSGAAIAIVAALFVLTAGWQFAQSPAASKAAAPSASVELGTVVVTVVDESGAPVEGAVVTPTGLRAREERLRSTGYGWMPERHGPVVKAVTDREGRARVRYPLLIVPAEKIFTGEIGFSVDHPDYATARVGSYPVAGGDKPVQLVRGIPLRVTAWFGANHQRVADIVPYLTGDSGWMPAEDWQRDAEGAFVWRRTTRGKHFLHVRGKLPSGELVYSDPLAFFGEQRDSHDIALELRPGVRVEGRIDAKVPRPIKNGWVQLAVHDDEANTTEGRQFVPRSFGNTGFWWSYRPLEPDGTFVFESVPEGELKLIAYGDGFISSNGPVEEQPMPLGFTPPPRPPQRVTRSTPQQFAAKRPVTAIEIATEATASVKAVVTAAGSPVRGARISAWPNVTHMPNGSRVFGSGGRSDEAPFRTLPPLPKAEYAALTDAKGVALLTNLPAFTSTLALEHAELEVPIREPPRSKFSPDRYAGAPNRYVDVALSPGKTTQVDVAVQSRGREFMGVNP